MRARIKSGEYTERGLARSLGVSQPQVHNVLKGARRLRPALADRFLRKFGITALELLSEAELKEAICTRDTARLAARTAAREARAAPVARFPSPDVTRRSSESVGTTAANEDLRRWRKPASRSARLNFRRSDKVS